ncbi:MAG: preprotein translocase subunit SecG [Patescibacteria group bacterium]|nr:preprotein translocase subunit SecG [Patescibacteria group bacterium]
MKVLSITQIIISVLIIALILLQAQGSGLGNTWSGGGETYHTKRGVEKVTYYSTIVLITLFIITSIVSVIN